MWEKGSGVKWPLHVARGAARCHTEASTTRLLEIGMFRHLRRPSPPSTSPAEPGTLRLALWRFVQSENWEDARDLVAAHPALLSAEADGVLAEAIATALAEGDTATAEHLAWHRALLHHCRTGGRHRALRGPGKAAHRPLSVRARRWLDDLIEGVGDLLDLC